MMRTTLRLATLVALPLALGTALAHADPQRSGRLERPAAVFHAAVVAGDAECAVREAEHCACVTAGGHPELCGSWVPLLVELDWETITIIASHACGQQHNPNNLAEAELYASCAGPGGFLVDEGGQTVDEIFDEGYDPERPVTGLLGACAAAYQTGGIEGPPPARALFY